mmetsp:Transcript_107200/g.167437  ORF Transcript_107200/g.167437 Transcript_107200/m.167437 type:complete len:261 (+) Transcript_107200:38-820(+)
MPKKLRKRKASDAELPESTGVDISPKKASIDEKLTSKEPAAVAAQSSSMADSKGEEKDKRGIVHLGSLPMYMRIEKLRHLMEQFGEVGRVYLAPEDKVDYQRRKRSGGNRKQRFTEGWVEFAKRRIARRVAETLNCTPIGGKKRHNFHRDDMWNIKYLPKFKWHQLKEGTIYNQQARKARLEQKIGQARRENEFFLESREKAKTREKIVARKAAKAGGESTIPSLSTNRMIPASSRDVGRVSSGGANTLDISDRILDSLF